MTKIWGRCECGEFHLADEFQAGETVTCERCGWSLRVPIHFTPNVERPWPVIAPPPALWRRWIQNIQVGGMMVWAVLVIGVLVYAFGWLLATGLMLPLVIIGLIAQHYYEKGRRAGRAERDMND